MARRRMVPPEFWRSMNMAQLCSTFRLLAIGTWNAADDAGRGLADPRDLRAELFRYDDELPVPGALIGAAEPVVMVPVERAIEIGLQELARCLHPDLVGGEEDTWQFVLYEIGGRRYYSWRQWRQFQVINRPSPPRYPAPDYEAPAQPQAAPPPPKPAPPPAKPTTPPPQETSSQAGPAPGSQADAEAEHPGYPPGFAELAQCHEAHSVRTLGGTDQEQLLAALQDAQAVGLPWQKLLESMRRMQEEYVASKPLATSPRIARIAFYLQARGGWSEMLRQAQAARDRPRGEPDDYGGYSGDDGPGLSDDTRSTLAEIRQMKRGAAHAT